MSATFLVQPHTIFSVILIIFLCVNFAGRSNKLTPAFLRAYLLLLFQKSWELFHFITVRWQMPSQEQKHKCLGWVLLVFQNSFIRYYSFQLCSNCSPFCGYTVHRIAVSNLISTPVAAYSNLRSKQTLLKRWKQMRPCDKTVEYFAILSTNIKCQ